MQSQVQLAYELQSRGCISRYDDFGYCAHHFSSRQRRLNAETILQRFFVGWAELPNLTREAVARSINPGATFSDDLEQAMQLAEGGFGPELLPPSSLVTEALRDYAQTELGAVALARLLAWDEQFITLGWREAGGALTEAGIAAYGKGDWRPLRVACNGDGPDTVSPSGVLLLPEHFVMHHYSTGDICHPLAMLHHELKGHVLPLKEGAGLLPGREMELICVRLESEMLQELGLPGRTLNWGRDDGTLDQTLHEASEHYYHGLVVHDATAGLIEIDPETGIQKGPARLKDA